MDKKTAALLFDPTWQKLIAMEIGNMCDSRLGDSVEAIKIQFEFV